MAKTKTPFLSLGAHGSVGGSITAQSRYASTLLREKPFPTDPYLLPQAYQRWLYQDYAHLWTQQGLSTREWYREAGVRFHLTGFQYWMRYCLNNLPFIHSIYHLDEPSAGVMLDSGPNGYHGTTFGALFTHDIIHRGAQYDGINDWSRPTNKTAFDLQPPFSIEGFVTLHKITAAAEHGTIWGKVISDYNHLNQQPGSTHLYWWLNTTDGLVFNQAFNLGVDIKHHVVLTYDGATMDFWLDGVLVDSDAQTGAVLADPTKYWCLASWDGTSRFSYITLDQHVIHTRILDETTIKRHSERSYPPGAAPVFFPVVDIDIGSPAISRFFSLLAGFTDIVKDNPANASGTINTVEIYADVNMAGTRVGTFYTTDGNTLKCRDSAVIGNVAAGAKRTFSGLSINVQTGDYIGTYYDTGRIHNSLAGFDGVWVQSGEHIDPGDETAYGFNAGWTLSLGGTG